MFKNLKNIYFVFLFVFISFLYSCGVYSFTGASIPPESKTVSVLYFQNRAPLVQPTLSQVFTEKLKDRLLTQTRLSLIPKGGDLNFEGEITDYSTSPVGVVAGETAQYQRLTITIHVKFTCVQNPKFNYDTNLSRYADYSNTKNLIEVESELIAKIVDLLTEEAFNKAVVNW